MPPDRLVSLIDPSGVGHRELIELAVDELRVSDRTARRLITRALEEGMIVKEGELYFTADSKDLLAWAVKFFDGKIEPPPPNEKVAVANCYKAEN